MAEACPICGSDLIRSAPRPGGRDVVAYSCPRCGDYVISGSLLASLPSVLARSEEAPFKLSHAIREMQRVMKGAELYTSTVDRILDRPLPRPKEQADLLIRWLAENVPGPGETVWVDWKNHGAIIGAKSEKGFNLVLEHLFDCGLVRGTMAYHLGEVGRAHATPTFDGWEYYEELKSGAIFNRKAFIAMKFGDPTLDSVVEGVFRVAVKQTGFDLVRLDDKPQAGLIDDRLRVEIQSSAFIISDLTHDNLGAYWEAGYAEGLGKPVIYTCSRSKFEAEKTHFDTNHHLTVLWDPSSPMGAGERLKATIRATLPDLATQEDGNV